MWAHRATCNFLEIINRLHVARPGGIRMNVVDEDFAALQAGEPKLASIIRESAVMRLMAAFERMTVNDLAVIRRTRLHVERDKFVRAVAEAFDAQRPDINEFLLPLDADEIGRGAGFIGTNGVCTGKAGQCCHGGKGAKRRAVK